jgi:D-sedoheptulose 7-phosphate isomerase
MEFIDQYLQEAAAISAKLDRSAIGRAVDLLARVRDRGGRLFLLGVGGGAANASHAAADFRRLVGLEAYAPTDNIPELTARVNDEGWESVLEAWLKTSRLRPDDLVMVFSVGGGDVENAVSPNLVAALRYAGKIGAGVIGVVGRDGGFTARVANVCILVPVVNPGRVTAHTESWQSVICHLLVSHPKLRTALPKWESMNPD